jgi:hypothetical protein
MATGRGPGPGLGGAGATETSTGLAGTGDSLESAVTGPAAAADPPVSAAEFASVATRAQPFVFPGLYPWFWAARGLGN